MEITSKKCTKCKQVKSIQDFHRDRNSKDGHYSYCKDCNCKRIREYYSTPQRKMIKRGVDKAYAASEQGKQSHIKATRKYNRSEKGQSKNKEYRAKYIKTEKGASIREVTLARYREQNEQKRKAQSAVTSAIQTNKLPRASTQKCADCENQAHHYHHWSYDPEHWLDVIPLCIDCHSKRHRKS